MMAHKHLHELLREDQEPFLLKKYISDRRCQLNRHVSKTTLQVQKRKPIIETSISKSCFFSFNDSSSPDVRKSPFFDFSPAPGKSPIKTPNSVFLHIPARTAALLLEAAMKIQKQSSNPNLKPKTQSKNVGFGLFGSILKRLGHRKITRNREIGESFVGGRKYTGKSKKVSENVVGFYYSGDRSRRDSMMDTCSSCRSEEFEEIKMAESCKLDRENGGFRSSFERQFCSSPFRFSLHKSPSSSGRGTPEISSPRRRSNEEKENHKAESTQEIQLEEEEKEQCSPVSVLDPPFEDDDNDEGHRHVNEDKEEDDDDDYECSYAIVQRAKQQLLQKLQRFEMLAKLDPIELEKRMLEDQDDDEEEEDEWEREESPSNNEGFIREVLSKSRAHFNKVSVDMKTLVTDLINEEKREHNGGFCDMEMAVKRVCKRLDTLKGVESNTIDMMVAMDMKREIDGWKDSENQVGETAKEIEVAIFGVLVEELLYEEMVSITGLEAETLQSFCLV